ncbi:hypothetical protein FHQ31_30690 [Klebsiella pneumoniae subsp. pneumoniae]|uniref:hypothetical protein n=1 Tax=Klebsiella pneumoniae TaxID=573 RepID=UPI001117D5BA|nr:hypothetical protein [Klebsiella pneumoniae]TNM68814.1 hypothetical protein FHQ31_30690 [Klebsiella pneumoniae subsp. pneumoniae]
MNKIIGLGVLLVSGSAMAKGESSNIVTQLMGAVDTTTLMATVTSLGLVAVGVKFGEKGITFVKRLIGKV